MKFAISSAHGLLVRGASGFIDEVDESRRTVSQVAKVLRSHHNTVYTFHDDTSTTQDENLKTIVDFHNSKEREFDISIHFNAYGEEGFTTKDPKGTEVFYITQEDLAANVAEHISRIGLINRGAKKETTLYFLNNTDKPAILIEVCFVNSDADTKLYKKHFAKMCNLIAQALTGK